jgi:hypothetical protein
MLAFIVFVVLYASLERALALVPSLRSASRVSRVHSLRASTQDRIMSAYLAEQRALQRERREERTRQEYFDEINALVEGQHPSYEKLCSTEFWEQFSRGLSPIASDPSTATIDAKYPGILGSHVTESILLNGGDVDTALDHLKKRGYSGVENVDWLMVGVDLQALADTMESLKAAGWPPVFVLMFDEAWRLLEGLFSVLEPILGDGCELEASLYGWALEPPSLTAEGELEKVGGNFGQPHRDFPYDQCHLEDGSPSVVSVWIPFVKASLDNGCMYVVPRENDPLFDKPQDKYHLTPTQRPFPYSHVRPLNTGAGTVLMWNTCTIHWGSSCSPAEYLGEGEESRKSIAMSFRVPQSVQAMREKEWDQYGRLPFTREEIAKGIPMHERMKLCLRGLKMYSVWHPEFHGFDKALVTAK